MVKRVLRPAQQRYTHQQKEQLLRADHEHKLRLRCVRGEVEADVGIHGGTYKGVDDQAGAGPAGVQGAGGVGDKAGQADEA